MHIFFRKLVILNVLFLLLFASKPLFLDFSQLLILFLVSYDIKLDELRNGPFPEGRALPQWLLLDQLKQEVLLGGLVQLLTFMKKVEAKTWQLTGIDVSMQSEFSSNTTDSSSPRLNIAV